MNRTEKIRSHLATVLLRDHGVAVATPSITAWEAHVCHGHYTFGWGRPIPDDGDPNLLTVAFCPEVIDKSTAHLDDEQLEIYLATVEVFLAAYIEDPLADPDAVRYTVEDRLYADHGDALGLMMEVEAQYLGS